MNDKQCKPPLAERRVDIERRGRVAEMSPEEMRRHLLTSEVSGLPNRRAFDEAGKAPAFAMCDVDGLKALNDRYWYEVGNALLKATGEALRKAGLDAYHDKGDEFLARGRNRKQLQTGLECARAILRGRTVIVKRGNGEILRFTGADFSYGVGKDLDEAEARLKRHKAEREARRETERGKLCGIRVEYRSPLTLLSLKTSARSRP